MAKVNDLQCIGDALIQGDAKVNGKLNNEILDVDDNCLIIDVCRRLDLSTVGNKIEIALPSGYVCNPTAAGTTNGTLGIETFGSNSTAWSTNAEVTVKYIKADISEEVTNPIQEILKGAFNTLNMPPFIKTYIKVEVTTAAVGGNTFAVIRGKIYCHKE